ncbi:MAG: thioredoxin domain-containing protein, partial [Pseudomonadota bacterium]
MSNNEFGAGNGGYNTNVSFGEDGVIAPVDAPEAVKDITTAEFMKEVIEESRNRPVLVDFWAPWCGPCKQLAPALERAVAGTRGAVKLVKMDIDKYPEVSGQMGIQSIPAVVAFVDGRPADMFQGAKPEGEIRAFIEKIAGAGEEEDQITKAIEHAGKLAENGQVSEAGQLYAKILSIEPNNAAALSGLGHIHLGEDDLDAAKALIAHLSAEDLKSAEVASLVSAIELAEQAASLGNHEELLAAVESNPADHQARLD